MLVQILVNKTIGFFLIMGMGFVLTKKGLVRSQEGRLLSILGVDVIMPCALLAAYQKDYSPAVNRQLLTAYLIAILVHAIFLLMARILEKPLGMTLDEKASAVYPSAATLTLPYVSAMFGPEWLIFGSAFISVQQVMIWSHLKKMICGEKKIEWNRLLKNINVIAIAVGLLSYFLQIRYPIMVVDALNSVGNMMAPLSMLTIGMLIADFDKNTLKAYPRLPLAIILRLVIFPLPILLLFKFSPLMNLCEDGYRILLISFLSVCTPSASATTQLSQIYGRKTDYAVIINIATTILCGISIPILVAFF